VHMILISLQAFFCGSFKGVCNTTEIMWPRYAGKTFELILPLLLFIYQTSSLVISFINYLDVMLKHYAYNL
jgi:hypothetical protein